MGLSNAVSGGIILFTIFYVMMSFPSIISGFTNVSHASSVNLDMENTIAHTNIQIQKLNSTASYSNVNFTLYNTGNEKLWNFDKFTVVISYDGGIFSKNRYAEQLTYDSQCSGAVDTWCIIQYYNNLTDPQILNPGEGIMVNSHLQNLVYTQGTVTASVSTDNGVTTSKSIVAS